MHFYALSAEHRIDILHYFSLMTDLIVCWYCVNLTMDVFVIFYKANSSSFINCTDNQTTHISLMYVLKQCILVIDAISTLTKNGNTGIVNVGALKITLSVKLKQCYRISWLSFPHTLYMILYCNFISLRDIIGKYCLIAIGSSKSKQKQSWWCFVFKWRCWKKLNH